MVESAALQAEQASLDAERRRLEAQFDKMRSDLQIVLERRGLAAADAQRVAQKAAADLLDCSFKSESAGTEPGYVIVRLNGSTYIMKRLACVFEILANAGVAVE